MHRLNVLHVCDHLRGDESPIRAATRFIAWMTPSFHPERVNVSVVSLAKKGPLDAAMESSGIEVTHLHKSPVDPATLTALLKIVDRRQIDLLHLHGQGAATFGRAAAAMRRLPAILHEHATPATSSWFQRLADRALAPFTDMALAGSRGAASFVSDVRFVPPARVKVVYPGVPLDEFGASRTAGDIEEARRELGIGRDDFAIGTLTRLDEAAGTAHLVEAARLVIDARPQAKFLLVGDGPLRPALESQARRLGLAECCVFVGSVADDARALAAFDLSVYPSLGEDTPLTIVEALAAGTPIIATDADGVLEIVTDGHDARIVPRRDAKALADRIVAMMDDPGERARLAAHARATGSRYDIRNVTGQMEELYERLHATSRTTHRRGILETDLSFLTGRTGGRG